MGIPAEQEADLFVALDGTIASACGCCTNPRNRSVVVGLSNGGGPDRASSAV
jgi:hypothetical protein